MATNEGTTELATTPVLKQRISLYDLTLEGVLIEEALIESDGELTPALEERFDRMLAEGPKAIDAASGIVRELVASGAAAKAEKDRQAARQKSFENNAAGLKKRIRIALDAAFAGKLRTPRFNLFTSKGRTSTSVDFLGLPDQLDHLYNARPDLVKEVKTYVLDTEAVLKIWDEEMPLLQAYNDAMSTWRGLLEAAGDDEDLKARVLAQEPVKYTSRIPEIVTVNITTGDRSLTIK